MKHDGVGRTLGWMATGAAVLMAGAFLGAAAGRRKGRPGRRNEEPYLPEPPEDLTDRPVARAAWEEARAAVERIDHLARTVSALESRVAGVESAARRVDEVWHRVLRIEQMLEEIRRQRPEPAGLEAAAAEAEARLAPRISAVEARVHQNETAIQGLQAHASQTDQNLQRMIAAVERLTDQISRALPPAPLRIEPKRETAAPPPEAAEGEGGPDEERGGLGLSRWRSIALIGAVVLSLAGSYAGVRYLPEPAPAAAGRPAAAPPAADRALDAAIASAASAVHKDPENLEWQYLLGRLYELQGNRAAAAHWYRQVLDRDPGEARAAAALAGLPAATATARWR